MNGQSRWSGVSAGDEDDRSMVRVLLVSGWFVNFGVVPQPYMPLALRGVCADGDATW